MSARFSQVGVAVFVMLSAGVAWNVMTQPVTQARLTRAVTAQIEANRAEANRKVPPAETGSFVPPRARTTPDGRPADPEATASDTVRAIQRELTARKYDPGSQDGVAGLVTRAAIYAFEEDHKVLPAGEPSEFALKLILLGAAPATAASDTPERRAAAEQLVRAVQQYLSALGYRQKKPDGRFAADTARAIREFELDKGLPPQGRITGPLVAALMKAAALPKAAPGAPVAGGAQKQ